jgi:hypothetical protein
VWLVEARDRDKFFQDNCQVRDHNNEKEAWPALPVSALHKHNLLEALRSIFPAPVLKARKQPA